MLTSTTVHSMKTTKPSLNADFLSLVHERKTKEKNKRTVRKFKRERLL